MKHFTLFLTFLFLVLTASAQQISHEQALLKAERFLNRSNAAKAKGLTNKKVTFEAVSQSNILGYVTTSPVADGKEPCQQLYFFNIGNDNGFVVVSGDERTPDILGYSFDGCISSSMPENMRWFLSGMAKEIESLQQSGKDLSPLSGSYQPIEPLITTHWNQNAPYNAQTPVIGGKQTPTGCVATAMAQIINYLRPIGSKAIPTYTTDTKKITVEALPATTFDWSQMEDSYTSSASAPEVAKLMRYCGQAVEMDYTANSSGAASVDVPDAVAKYFGCSELINMEYRADYTRDKWNELIHNELTEQRPVYLRGSNAEGGHAFICDGYDTDGLFHINWGWGGLSDGFFLLSALSPNEQGTGGSSSGYNSSLSAIINWHLAKAGEKRTYSLTCTSDDRYNSFFSSPTREDDGTFYISVTQVVYNYNKDITQYYFGWELRDSENNQLATFPYYELLDISTNNGKLPTCEFTIPSTLADGTYYLVPVCRTTDTDTWSVCNGSDAAELILTISNDEITCETANPPYEEKFQVSNVQYSSDLFVGAPFTFYAKVTNEGTSTTGELKIIDAASPDKPLAIIALEMDPGETQDVSGTFTLKSAGSKTFRLTNESNNQSFAINVNVAAESLVPLDFTQTITSESTPDEDGDKVIHLINTNSIDVKVVAFNITGNPDELPYRSTVCWFLEKEDGTYTSRTYPLSLSYGYKKTFSQTFSGLEKDITYKLYIGYKGTDGVYQVTDYVAFRYTDIPSVLNDDFTEYSNTKNKVVDFNYTRNFTNTSWQAFYVPFAMTYDDWKNDFEMAYISDIIEQDTNGDGIADNVKVEVTKMQNGDTTQPNTPYLIKAKTTGEKVFSQENATLYKTVENTTDFTTEQGTHYNIIGTYHTISDMATKHYYAMVDGSLKTATTDAATLKPFRWYFSITDNEGNTKPLSAKSITIVDTDNDNATGITNVNTTNSNADIISLEGRNMGKDATHLTPGIYIKNGKKFIVK